VAGNGDALIATWVHPTSRQSFWAFG